MSLIGYSSCLVCGELFQPHRGPHECPFSCKEQNVERTTPGHPAAETSKKQTKVQIAVKGGQLQLNAGGIRCQKCNGIFAKQWDFDLHVVNCEIEKQKHTNGFLLILPEEAATSKPKSDDEDDVAPEPTWYSCNECKSLFSDAGECKKHFIENHVQPVDHNNRLNRSDLVKAWKSGKEAEMKAYLNQLESRPNLPTHTCSICEATYAESLELFDHMAIVHDKRVLFRCQDCGMVFVQRLALTRHLAGHAAAENRMIHPLKKQSGTPYECHYCGKQFSFQSYFRRHMATHTQDSYFVCNICGDEFRSQGQLALHKAKHTGQELHKCSKCGKEFPYRSYLERHYITHTSAPIQCVVCGKDFNVPAQLKKHMALHHSNVETTLTCPQCDRKFLYPSSLERHLATHMHAKQHECPMCFRRFGSRNALLTHLQRHLPESFQPENLLQCGYCTKKYQSEGALLRHIERAHEKAYLHESQQSSSSNVHEKDDEKDDEEIEPEEQLPGTSGSKDQDAEKTTNEMIA